MNRMYVILVISVTVVLVSVSLIFTRLAVYESIGNETSTYIGENKFLLDDTGKEVGAASKYTSDVPGNKFVIKATMTVDRDEGEYGVFYNIDGDNNEIFIGKMQYVDGSSGNVIIEYKSDDTVWSPMTLLIKNTDSGKVIASTRFV